MASSTSSTLPCTNHSPSVPLGWKIPGRELNSIPGIRFYILNIPNTSFSFPKFTSPNCSIPLFYFHKQWWDFLVLNMLSKMSTHFFWDSCTLYSYKNHQNKPIFSIDLKPASHCLLGGIWFGKKHFPWVNPNWTDSQGAQHIMSCCTAVPVPCEKKDRKKNLATNALLRACLWRPCPLSQAF